MVKKVSQILMTLAEVDELALIQTITQTELGCKKAIAIPVINAMAKSDLQVYFFMAIVNKTSVPWLFMEC